MNSEEVKQLRATLGLSQDRLAAKIGVAPYTVRRWEAGDDHPSEENTEKLKRLARKKERELTALAVNLDKKGEKKK